MKCWSIFISFTLFIFSGANSQDKIGVGILPFSNLGQASNSDLIAIQEAVTNAFVKTKRFNIVDRTKMDALKREKELQKSEDFIDGKVIQQGVSLGAEFLVSGKVTSVTKSAFNKERTRSDGSKQYVPVHEAEINFSCQVIDVETGQVINSETFSTSGGGTFLGLSLAKNAEEAFASSLEGLSDKIDDWVGINFPLELSIAEIQEQDGKGAATKILLAGGSSLGLEKGERLKVVEVSMIKVNGKDIKRKKEIGELKISKIEDENFSTCSVKEGGLDISTRFNAKAKILVMTKK